MICFLRCVRASPYTLHWFTCKQQINKYLFVIMHDMLVKKLTNLVPKNNTAMEDQKMRASTLEQLRRHLRPGRVYRREDLLPWSRSVDRHLKELTVDGTLQKLRTGLYYSPRKFEFGEAPADEHELVKAFLKTDRFVVTSPNAYNQLGLGTTQLYNKRVVYNQKRHGTFPLGNRMVTFERRLNVPRQLSPEFLLVDLVNELGDLAEDRDAVLSRVREKAKEMDPKKLSRAVSLYGKYSTQKKFQEMLQRAV